MRRWRTLPSTPETNMTLFLSSPMRRVAAGEAVAIEGADHFVAEDLEGDLLPFAELDRRGEGAERHGDVGAGVIVVVLLDVHTGSRQEDAADVVLGVAGADAEEAGLAAIERDVVQAHFATDDHVLEIKADGSGRRVVHLGIFRALEGAVDGFPMAAAGDDIAAPALEAAGEERGAALGRRGLLGEVLADEKLAGLGHEGGGEVFGAGEGREKSGE